MDIADARQKLAEMGQDHVVRYVDHLPESGVRNLLGQLDLLDLENIAELVETQVRQKPQIPLPKRIEPARAYPRIPDADRVELYRQAQARGRQLLQQGKVAAFLVAGGQGTRLGYDGPKGEFPVTPVKKKPLFQVFAEQLLSHSRESGKSIPWYIMTSDANDARTRAFFTENNFFGYPKNDVVFFQQGMMPAFSLDGKMLLSAKESLALSPDGHGGSLRALARNGALADMKRRGIEHLSYFQVDNPLVHTIDPLFLGLHDLTGSEMSSKMIPKAGPLERVGNFVIGDGLLQVIEYSDLPEELAYQKNPDGALRFNAGSIAIHALRVPFIVRLNAGNRLQLPWHRAEKKVPYIDANGNEVSPDKPNAVKLEQFVFDAITLAKNPIVFETVRAEEFSPVKNAEGVDSPATATRDQIRRAARWIREVGGQVPMNGEDPAAVIEISPLFASTVEQLRGKAHRLPQISRGQSLYLE